MNLQRCDVVLLNDDQTPMEFVVFVLERFFGMARACTHKSTTLIDVRLALTSGAKADIS